MEVSCSCGSIWESPLPVIWFVRVPVLLVLCARSVVKEASPTFGVIRWCEIIDAKGGKSEIEKHFKTNKHRNSVTSVQSQVNIDKLLTAPSTIQADKVKNAELLMTAFIIEHNFPFSISSHLSKLVLQMCPDSSYKMYSSCQNVVGRKSYEDLSAKLKVNNFFRSGGLSFRQCWKEAPLCCCSNSRHLTELGSATAQVLFDVVQKSFQEGGIEL
ncbi:hypothetical protein PR048_013971 [Dryococelus australis]|uniref:Uncharacterized protein n=1 Tax=Dryococelus australis TaxID=614101 RepID=A0ABQ9HVB6_9NEOP|nr:hypothetical protein PR048_013971 [Dryococelus australis]